MRNLLDLLDHAAATFGSKCCASEAESSRTLSFSELKTQSERVAAALHAYGIKAGDHVAILLPNCANFLPVYFGILRAGATAVPVNARLKTDELEFILADSEARALFVHPWTWKAAAGALGRLEGLRRIVAVDFPANGTCPPNTITFGALLEDKLPVPPRPVPETDAVAAIIYTSGTTGRPKGAMLTHGNILFNVASTKAAHGLRPGDTHLLVVPLFHVTGLNTIMPTALDQGAQLVISAQIDPEDVLLTIERFRCTTFFGVPTTFYLLTNLKGLRLDGLASLRLVCYSGAPMSEQTICKLRDLFPKVELHNFYGLTETTSVTTVLPDAQAIPRAASIGLPPPGLELAVFDEKDRALPAGQVGELCVKGSSVFKGYYKRADATADALRGGWFHTGDTAYRDAEGYVFLQGRKKEMIIVAGENVYPIEVENVLLAHPAVQEAAVFGREDKALGEVVHAAVVLRAGHSAAERELKQWAAERLAAFKVPRSVRILPALPRNASGKVMKRDL